MSVLIKLTDREYKRLQAILKDKLKSISTLESDQCLVRDYFKKSGDIKAKTQIDEKIENYHKEYCELCEMLCNMDRCVNDGIVFDTKRDL